MSDETYNGWTNRETWAANLHVDNDEYLHNQVQEFVTDSREDEDQDTRDWIAEVADKIEEEITNLCDPRHWRDEMGCEISDGAAMMASDIGSLWRVDWTAIADSNVSEYLLNLD